MQHLHLVAVPLLLVGHLHRAMPSLLIVQVGELPFHQPELQSTVAGPSPTPVAVKLHIDAGSPLLGVLSCLRPGSIQMLATGRSATTKAAKLLLAARVELLAAFSSSSAIRAFQPPRRVKVCAALLMSTCMQNAAGQRHLWRLGMSRE